jgi:esterase/lipase superfamily enzyme
VFYGTNRARTGDAKPATFYGGDRGDLELGHLDVTVPETHKYGELESESIFSIYTYVLGDEGRKKRYVLLQDVTPLGKDDFYSKLSAHVGDSPSNDVFLFVHGYNSSFEDAARRAAQLAYDLDFDGTPMLYSWPSQGSTAAYTVDEAVVRLSGQKMSRFLEDVVAQSGADRIHLIAHSMGNRAMIEALQSYIARQDAPQPEKAFGQIVFTAPDVDRDYFAEVIEVINKVANRVTLYASENDVALKSSRLLHGAPRAGQAGASMITHPGIDSIDMSAVEADLLGHTYFAANQGAIHDLFRLFWRGEPPSMRCGMNADQNRARFWSFKADECKGADLLQASVLVKRFGKAARERVRARIAAITDRDGDSTKKEWQQILERLNGLLAEDRP